MSREFYVNQLRKLSGRRQVIVEQHHAKIACPFHNDGKENTPSLRLNLDNSSGFPAGRGYCFACGKKANWQDFIKHELIKPYKLKAESGAQVDINLNVPELTIDEPTYAIKMDEQIRFAPLWDKHTKWRGISGKLLHKLQARQLPTKYGEQMYMPAYVNNEFYGGIKCRLAKHKSYPSYINDAGKWVRHTVIPYDYCKALLAKQKPKRRVLFLGEGLRDALNPLQYGVPAVCVIGGKTVWTKEKADLILSLKPDLIVLAFDPDEVGNAVTELAKNDLQHEVILKRLNFSKLPGGEKQDPGNTPKARWLRLKQQLELI